jgi:hypothetical protein
VIILKQVCMEQVDYSKEVKEGRKEGRKELRN